jgi:pilus assembly protein CpaB
VLSRSALDTPGASTLAALVEPGERALTIPVDESSGAAGLLAPGDYIDLLVVLRDDGIGGDVARAPRVQPLLQAVQVLATGRATRARGGDAAAEPDASYATITLRLHPVDAQRVLLAQKIGELSVAVRPSGETQSQALPPMGRESLWPVPLGVPVHQGARPAPVEFIIGGTGGGTLVVARATPGQHS